MAAGTRRAKDSATKAPVAKDEKVKSQEDTKSASATDSAAAGQPLGPPPRPAQGNNENEDGGYFGQSHGNKPPHGYQAEPNPFDQQFGNPSTNTPGKLPSVAQLTSPQSLLPNTPSEMRLGPLSPAMLAGPATGDYFDSSYSRSFPTPNESSLRTGLTPGGGGSMFPAPSPNTQAIFNQFGLGGATTPSINEFIRTGISAKTATTNGAGPTSQPVAATSDSMDLKMPNGQNGTPNGFAHPESDAANGLFMLAQANGSRSANFATSTSQPETQASSSMAGSSRPAQAQNQRKKTSVGSSDSQGDDQSESDRSEEPAKPATRSRGKKPAAESKTPNNRRKATDTPTKGSAAKRRKVSVSQSQDMDDDEDGEDDGTSPKDTKKMTDEEKRKNFLERNRVAALKCRQRKKQWLSNLQSKVDIYTQENDALQQCCNQLRDQVAFLKNALAAHRGCPVFQNMGISQQQYEALLSMEVAVPYMIPTTAAPNGISSVPMMAPTGGQVLPPR